MTFIITAIAELFLCFTGVVYYAYGYEHYVANAEHPLLEKVCLSILTGLYIFMCTGLILKQQT